MQARPHRESRNEQALGADKFIQRSNVVHRSGPRRCAETDRNAADNRLSDLPPSCRVLFAGLDLLVVDGVRGALATLDQIGQRDLAQEREDFVTELIPKGVGQATLAIAAVFAAAAAREFHPLINSANDVGDRDDVGVFAKIVPTARTAYPAYELFVPKRGKQLL